MKMLAYAVKEEERKIFEKYVDDFDVELTMTEESPSTVNLTMAEGMDVINVLSETLISEELWDGFSECGVRLGVTRTVGREHMNEGYAAKLGIGVRNISYSPASVADYAIMMMMMVLRNIKPVMQRYIGQDYVSEGLRGRELPNRTVGVIGAGRIGQTVLRHLTGFGCRLCYWDRKRKTELEGIAEYMELEQLLASCDILSIHLSSAPETYHFIGHGEFRRMRPETILINTARGDLVDLQALIEALDEERIAAAGLDVFEGDRSIYYHDYKNQKICTREMAYLNSMPNVLMLPHIAYFTDQAMDDMVRNSLAVSQEFFLGQM